ncbi:glycosyltransferase family 2 protein [Streptomyces sp. NPDC046931]|uniref:glycosyltransferase family 2 protein n=1 Tax=Streptomyces sp. NPDC046931 TaxID=3154806 RepID=UPI0033DD85E6
MAVKAQTENPVGLSTVDHPGKTSEKTALRRQFGRRHPPVLVAAVPAHNEEGRLASAIASIKAQQTPVSRIIVIVDRCTDRAADIARASGCHVIETAYDDRLKAGVLNHVLPGLLGGPEDTDLLLITDADSTICPEFTEVALRCLHARPEVGAVGGVFYGRGGSGLLGALQRNEYARYAREVARRGGRATVLTGTRDRLPCRGTANGGRGPRHTAAGPEGLCLRRRCTDRGQRDHPGRRTPRMGHSLSPPVPGHHRASCPPGATSSGNGCDGSAARWKTCGLTD